MFFLPKNKKVRLLAPVAGALLFIILNLYPVTAHAWELSDILLVVPAWIVYGIIFAAWMVLNYLLTIVAFVLDNVFFYNVIMNPMNMPFVIQGWGVTRDIANSFFILIILWIALTIIFNIEHLGGKQLLIRVIIIALLINFSLAITGAVFGFANMLAKPLRDKIPEEVGAWITGRLALQTTADTPTASNTGSVGNYATMDCGISALMSAGGRGCIGGNIAQSASVSFSNSETKPSSEAAKIFQLATSMGISTVILLVVIAAFIIAIGNLFVRIIAMAMLGILSPLAFLAFVVPGGKLKGVWDKWLSSLFTWAFYAPAFYFLFYLSLLVLNAMGTGSQALAGSTAPVQNNLLRLLPIAIFVGFLLAAVNVGKKMGITTGEAALSVAKIAGVAALTGGATLAAGGAASLMRRPAVREGMENAMDRVSRVPVIGKLTRPIVSRTAEHYAGDQKDVLEKSKKLNSYSPDQQVQMMRTATFAKDIAAAANSLMQTKKGIETFNKLSESEKTRALNMSSRFGLQKDILTLNPHLIKDEATAKQFVPKAANREAAIWDTVKKVDDKTKISEEVYSTPEARLANKDVLNAAWGNIRSPKELGRIAGEAPDLANAMLERINGATAEEIQKIKQELGAAKVDAINRYLAGGQAQRVWGLNPIRNREWTMRPGGAGNIEGGEGFVAV